MSNFTISRRTIRIEGNAATISPEVDERIRSVASRIMNEKIMQGLGGLYKIHGYAAQQALIHDRVIHLLYATSCVSQSPLDALVEQFYQWVRTRPDSTLDCAELVYHRALAMKPFPWEVSKS